VADGAEESGGVVVVEASDGVAKADAYRDIVAATLTTSGDPREH